MSIFCKLLWLVSFYLIDYINVSIAAAVTTPYDALIETAVSLKQKQRKCANGIKPDYSASSLSNEFGTGSFYL